MVFLLRNNEQSGKGTIYEDKIFIFKNVLQFSDIDDYSLLFKNVLMVMEQFNERLNMHDNIKARLQKLLTMGANLKYFNAGNFSEYKKEEYLKKVQEGIELIYNKPTVDNYLLEFETVEITDVEANLYSDGYKEPKKISICNIAEDSEERFSIFFPKEICDENQRHVVLAIEKITGNFEDDVVLSLLNMFENITIDIGIKNHGTSYSICKLNCHQDIAIALRKLVGTICYLKNCTSMRNNEWFSFDEMYLQDNTGYIECIIDNTAFIVS